jgi:dihydroorotate dehydrogenase (fumarate)
MDLSTEYLGLTLRNPLVASASPLSQTSTAFRRLADAGVGAVVLYSLFEEQLRQQAALDAELAEAGSERSPRRSRTSRTRPRRSPARVPT